MIDVVPTLASMRRRLPGWAAEWAPRHPFRYVVVDDFLSSDLAEAIHSAFPAPDWATWDGTNYLHQRAKFVRTSGFPVPIARYFELTASEEFRALMSELSGIGSLLSDAELVGGGLHQIGYGGFLDVHVDFNQHPRTKLYRRLNLLLYLNKDWKREYGGQLELWDMQKRVQLEDINPLFNRAVLFETTETSFHGHPRPLAAPPGHARKSLAVYYYTVEPGDHLQAPEHNTLYKQTTGLRGYLKTLASAFDTAIERTHQKGIASVCATILHKLNRALRGQPPENR